MTKNLSPLTWLEENYPDKAEEYKFISKEKKRQRAREYQKKVYKAYKENTRE